jgi:hypothetical protein
MTCSIFNSAVISLSLALVLAAGSGAVANSTPHGATVTVGLDEQLVAVSADSPSDAWAVGDRGGKALVWHWNGSSWAPVSVPRSRRTAKLTAVAALSPTDVWVVGLGVIEHWDGSKLSVVSSPGGSLYGISAVSYNDIWAVGQEGGASRALHWDGVTWNLVSTPDDPPNEGGLLGVAAVSADDVWAAGYRVEHWNGRHWKVVADFAQSGFLTSLSAVSADDVWGVGQGNEPGPISARWDGTSWSEVYNGLEGDGFLKAVSAVAADDVWAAGARYGDGPRGSSKVDLLRWNGSQWRRAKAKTPGSYGWVNGVSADSASNAWAVGFYAARSGALHALLEHWDGSRWTLWPAP